MAPMGQQSGYRIMVNVDRNGFASITLKVANLRKEQKFVIYPYKGDETIVLQSSGRIIKLNLLTGKAIINSKNQPSGAGFVHLMFNVIEFDLQKEELTSIKKYLWEKEGKPGGSKVLSWENEELYSKVV